MSEVRSIKIGSDERTIVDQGTRNSIALDYDASHAYKIGEICYYNSVLKKCTINMDQGETYNPLHWEDSSVSDRFIDIETEKANKDGYYVTLGAGTAENLIDAKATAVEQEWLGVRTSCGDESISDDGTARIDAIYGNTVNGVNMTVDAIETVGFNLFDKDSFTGATETYGGRECIKTASTAALIKLIDDGAYLGLGQIEYSAYIHRGTNYYPRILVEYTDGTQETISYYKVEGGGANAWGTYYFLTNAEKAVASISSRHSGATSSYPEYIALDTICIHYVWSGYRNGEFEEYWKKTHILPVLDYFPNGMMSVGDVRDELRADRAIQRCEFSGGTVVALEEEVITVIDPPLTPMQMTYQVSDFGTENAKTTRESAPLVADILYSSDFPRAVTNVVRDVGTRRELLTTNKDNLVAAINELVARVAALEGG